MLVKEKLIQKESKYPDYVTIFKIELQTGL